MKTFIALVCFIATVNVCTASVCLINPQQRGSMGDLNTVGSFDCRVTVRQCGGRQAQVPIIRYKYSETTNITVTFQKNMDFWIRSNPGYFVVNILSGGYSILSEIARVEDRGEPSLYVYTVTATPPPGLSLSPFNYVLQVVYITNNPEAPIFYPCTDITFVK